MFINFVVNKYSNIIMKKMSVATVRLFIVTASVLLSAVCAVPVFAQQQEKEKTPEEVAAAEVKAMVSELKLSESQEFFCDSILTHNYTCMKSDFESLQNSGMQEASTYQFLKDRWEKKTLEALKKVLDDQQYIRYLRRIGKGKDYKKGKDGKFYLKSDLEKEKNKDTNK
ncbi:MAG: hypothetical protein PHW85_03135 [Bacteroidales bacterium]|nr:hypothetical protein [Bacteroidales bacterium]